jgi:hypothetical protein
MPWALTSARSRRSPSRSRLPRLVSRKRPDGRPGRRLQKEARRNRPRTSGSGAPCFPDHRRGDRRGDEHRRQHDRAAPSRSRRGRPAGRSAPPARSARRAETARRGRSPRWPAARTRPAPRTGPCWSPPGTGDRRPRRRSAAPGTAPRAAAPRRSGPPGPDHTTGRGRRQPHGVLVRSLAAARLDYWPIRTGRVSRLRPRVRLQGNRSAALRREAVWTFVAAESLGWRGLAPVPAGVGTGAVTNSMNPP